MWEHLGTYLLSAVVASLGGLWYYFDTHARKSRRLSEALVAMLGSALLGLVVSLVACYYLCEREQALPLVVAISAMSGLLGWTPQYAVSLFRQFLVKDTKHEPTYGPSIEGDSDPDSPFV